MKKILTHRYVKAVSIGAGALTLAGKAAVAQSVADPSTITTTATTAFGGVATLVVSMVGFFIIVRIVKGIRK